MGISKTLQGIPYRTKQGGVVEFLIPQAQLIKLVWYGENDMKMPNGQNHLRYLLYPLHLFGNLAFGAMPVTTAIVAVSFLTAVGTYFFVPTHGTGAALGNIVQGLYLRRR